MPGTKGPSLTSALSLGPPDSQTAALSHLGPSTDPGDVANARADPLPDARFIKNRRSGGSALMKKFFPGDDDDELPDIKPAATATPKNGQAGWQRIDGGPKRKDIDAPSSEHSKDTKRQAEASPTSPDEIQEKAQVVAGIAPPATPMDVDPRGAAPERDSVRGLPVDAPSPAPAVQIPPPSLNRNSQRLTTSPTSTAANEDVHALRKTKANEPLAINPRDGEIYTIVSQVGEGTFGQVYKAVNTINNSKVALKRIRMEGEKDGFPVTAMREIKLLQSLRHENVVKLHEMMVSKSASL